MKHNHKIDDVYVFYMCSGYVGGTAEEELSMAEICGVETQEELDNLDEETIEKYLEDEFKTFRNNLDQGWYKKEQDD